MKQGGLWALGYLLKNCFKKEDVEDLAAQAITNILSVSAWFYGVRASTLSNYLCGGGQVLASSCAKYLLEPVAADMHHTFLGSSRYATLVINEIKKRTRSTSDKT